MQRDLWSRLKVGSLPFRTRPRYYSRLLIGMTMRLLYQENKILKSQLSNITLRKFPLNFGTKIQFLNFEMLVS